jgi:hypothetical protein
MYYNHFSFSNIIYSDDCNSRLVCQIFNGRKCATNRIDTSYMYFGHFWYGSSYRARNSN